MALMELRNFMAYELVEKIKKRELSVQELVKSSFERINATEDKIHSFVNLSEEKALKKAKELDDRNKKKGKRRAKLFGIPFANKDLICVKDFPTTCGSKILQGYNPPYNAFVIEQLVEKAEAIHVGNTNMDLTDF